MNPNEDRWHQCYWKEWDAIKKRCDELTWRERAKDGPTQNKVKLSRLAVHLRKA
ncbi:MAG: hypothetical protein ACREV4_14730 [Gammaproteobacteria bacterium]